MPEVTQKVTLLRHTLSPEEVVALGARLCYSRATLADLEQRIAAKDQRAFVEKLLDMGHESVLEHASFTFGVEGVSRVLLAQLTRHRLASFSVQSQRYVSYEKGFGYIVPPKIAALGPEAQAEYQAQMAQMHAWYVAWQEKLGQGEGISRLTLEKCDRKVSLPMKGKIDSLNASVAAGVMMYRVLQSRTHQA